MSATILQLHKPSGYAGQYLKIIPRRNKSGIRYEYWFKPSPDQRPQDWPHAVSIRVPTDPAMRSGLDRRVSPREYDAAWDEAAELFAEMNRMRGAPQDGKSWPTGTLRWLITEWLKSDWFTLDLADTTQHLYRQQIATIEDWTERSGNQVVARMTAKDIATFLHEFDDRPAKRGHLRLVMKNLFSYAIEIGLRNDNPVDGIVMRRTKGKTRATVIWDQAFVDACAEWGDKNGHPEASAMVLLMWDCGRRPDDIFRLVAMNDMDRARMMNGTLNKTTRSIFYDPQERIVRGWVHKTRNFISIPLDPPTIAAINLICPTPTENRRHLFVHQKTGEPYTTDTWKWIWCQMRDYAGVPTAKWQNGRASCIVRMKRAGLDDNLIISVSDHANPATVYKHYWTSDDTQAAEAKRQRAEFETGE